MKRKISDNFLGAIDTLIFQNLNILRFFNKIFVNNFLEIDSFLWPIFDEMVDFWQNFYADFDTKNDDF